MKVHTRSCPFCAAEVTTFRTAAHSLAAVHPPIHCGCQRAHVARSFVKSSYWPLKKSQEVARWHHTVISTSIHLQHHFCFSQACSRQGVKHRIRQKSHSDGHQLHQWVSSNVVALHTFSQLLPDGGDSVRGSHLSLLRNDVTSCKFTHAACYVT